MKGLPRWIALYILLTGRLSSCIFVYPEAFNHTTRDSLFVGQFPDGFMWGVASSAYQVEGAWNEGGKGESIWDRFTHDGLHENGDTSCDCYHNIDRDIRLMKKMGLTHYQFSISWTRLIPDGRSLDKISIPGVNYYNYLIDGLIQVNITPVVTMYHWDLPQTLQEDGGWLNDTIISDFLNYAVVCYQNYADRVPYWITFDDPYKFCVFGYGNGSLAPGTGDPGTGPYLCANNVIRAHALAYRMYDDNFRRLFNGRVGISLNFDWYEPKNILDSSDVATAKTARQFLVGWFAHPIFLDGDYPGVMKTRIRDKSLQQGSSISRLPEMTAEQRDMIIRTSDFFGMSHYTTKLVTALTESGDSTPTPSWATDANIEESLSPSWPTTSCPFDRVVPWGIRKSLQWIKKEYNNPEILITGNGVASPGDIDDLDRVLFLKAYTNEVLKAIEKDGVNVIGFTVRSLMDSFEWSFGYDLKYGLHRVDFSREDRARMPRLSMAYYTKLVEDNGFTSKSSSSSGNLTLIILTIASAYVYKLAYS